MNREAFALLFDYNEWANRRILDTAEKLTGEQYVAAVPGLSHGSIRATLVHTLAAERIWRQRCLDGLSPSSLLREADLTDLAALRALWVEEEKALRDGLERLSDERLVETFAYQTTGGRPMADARWQVLLHLINHSTQHRAETAVALTAFGHSPGDVDLIVYLRQ